MSNFDKNEELNLTYSSLLAKNGRRIVRVCFERRRGGEREFAEGIVPEGKIENSRGFSEQEKEQLEEFLREHAGEIMAKAREITGISHWFKDN